jgi:hypothetical protein
MVEIVIKENEQLSYDWKKTAKKLAFPVITTIVLAGGTTLIDEINNLGLQAGSMEFIIAGLVVGSVKAGMNWYKHWYQKSKLSQK